MPALRRHPASFFTGLSYLSGQYRGRDVAVRLQLKRGRHGRGYLVLAMQTRLEMSLSAAEIDRRAADDAGRRALYDLARVDLLTSVEDGWLTAVWSPQGLVFFPGPFVEEHWMGVLAALDALAASLERRRVVNESVRADA